MMTTKALDKLPISANSSLPEYQRTQEWFEQVISELKEVEESNAAPVTAAVGGKNTGTGMDPDMQAKTSLESFYSHLLAFVLFVHLPPSPHSTHSLCFSIQWTCSSSCAPPILLTVLPPGMHICVGPCGIHTMS